MRAAYSCMGSPKSGLNAKAFVIYRTGGDSSFFSGIVLSPTMRQVFTRPGDINLLAEVMPLYLCRGARGTYKSMPSLGQIFRDLGWGKDFPEILMHGIEG